MEGEQEFEVEEFLAHNNKLPEYLVRFKGYCPQDNLWLTQHNLEHAPEILLAYQSSQTNNLS